jgi:hypothetical protein
MNLTSDKYDIIMLDAFMDVSNANEICAPEPFLTERFVRKVRDPGFLNAVEKRVLSAFFSRLSPFKNAFKMGFICILNGLRYAF